MEIDFDRTSPRKFEPGVRNDVSSALFPQWVGVCLPYFPVYGVVLNLTTESFCNFQQVLTTCQVGFLQGLLQRRD